MTTTNRLWIIVTAALAIGIFALGWFLGVGPKVTEANDANDQRLQVEALNQQKSIETEQLKADYANLAAVKVQLAELQAQLPANSNYPDFLSELNALAAAQSVSVTNVTVGAPAILGATTDPAPAATTAPDGTVSNAAPSGSTVAIPTTLTLSGSFDDLQAATGALQAGDRLFVISGLSYTSVGGDAGYTAVVTGDLFVLTDGSTLVAAAPITTAAPTPTSTPAP